MELLKEIYPLDNKGTSLERLDHLYAIRKAARCVLFNKNQQIALLYVSKLNYHKLPGGGIEHKEPVVEALKREVREEVGERRFKLRMS